MVGQESWDSAPYLEPDDSKQIDVYGALQSATFLQDFLRRIVDEEAAEIEAAVRDLDTTSYGQALGTFIDGILQAAGDGDEYRSAWESPFAMKMRNFLEAKLGSNTETTPLVKTVTWLTFALERMTNRLQKKATVQEEIDVDKTEDATTFTELEKLRTEVDVLQAVNRRLSDTNSNLRSYAFYMEAELKLLGERNDVMEKENGEMKRVIAEEMKKLQKDNASVTEEIQKMTAQLAEENAGKQSQLGENHADQEEKTKMEERIRTLEAEIKRSRTEHLACIKKNLDLRELLSETNNICNRLETRNSKLLGDMNKTKPVEEEQKTTKNGLLPKENQQTGMDEKKKELKIDKLVLDFAECAKKLPRGSKENGHTTSRSLIEMMRAVFPRSAEEGTHERRMMQAQLLLPFLIDNQLAEQTKQVDGCYQTIIKLFEEYGLQPGQ